MLSLSKQRHGWLRSLPKQRHGWLRSLPKQRLERIAESLAALTESGFDNRAEKLLITAERGAGVAGEANHGGLDLWRRIERPRTHSEKIFNVIPRLKEDRQDAVSLGAGLLGDAFGDLLLDHADNLRDAVAMLQNLEKNLRGNIIRKIPYH